MAARGNPRADESLAEALARGATIKDAARTCGISETTVRRRLKDDGFQALLAQVRGGMLGRSIGHVLRITTDAAQALEDLVREDSPEELLLASAPLRQVRLAAAKAIFEHAFKGRELLDLEERLRQLEERLAAQGVVE